MCFVAALVFFGPNSRLQRVGPTSANPAALINQGEPSSVAGLVGEDEAISQSESAKNVPPTDAERAGARDGEISYDELQEIDTDDRLKTVRFSPYAGSVELEFADGSKADSKVPPMSTKAIDNLAAHGVEVEVLDSGEEAGGGSGGFPWGTVISGVFIIAVILIALNFGTRGQRAEQKQRDKESRGSEVDLDSKGRPLVTFASVAGCDEAVTEVSEFLDFINHPHRFARTGAKTPSGMLLYGPPGTGKTLLAKALAGESGIGFFSASGTEFVERYVGVGAARVRELFQRARKHPHGAVVFIDEIDSIGRKRGSSEGAGGDVEREATLNQLLVELDGFSGRDGVVVIGATNRMELLDPALLRPGRLSRQVMVNLPDRNGRRAILELYAHSKPLADEVDLDALSDYTAGSSGADLAEMLNEAAIMAARENRAKITQEDLIEGHLRVLMGPERASSPATEEEREIIAYHEAGHALCAELCPNHEKAQRATIKPRGQAAGVAVYGQLDRALHSLDYLQEQLICSLGGRAAEQVVFETVSSGAANDLQKANGLARQAIEELGLSKRTGQLITRQYGQSVGASERTRAIIDQEVEGLVADAYGDALDLLESHRSQLDALASALLRHGDLDRLQILDALGSLAPRRPSGQRLGPKRTAALDSDIGVTSAPEPIEKSRSRKPKLKPAVASVRAAIARRRRARLDADS